MNMKLKMPKFKKTDSARGMLREMLMIELATTVIDENGKETIETAYITRVKE